MSAIVTINLFFFLGPDPAKSYVGAWAEEIKIAACDLSKP